MFTSPETLRKLVSMESTGREAFRSPKSLLHALAEPVTAARLADAGLRYVVLLDARVTTGPARLEGPVIWSQHAAIDATILDARHLRVTGSVRTSLIGEEGVGVGFVLESIPIPYYFTSMTESKNCKELGEELAVFFNYKG